MTLPFPTMQSLSVEWAISGDANLNGIVKMRYRPAGGSWRDAMALRRVPAGSNAGFSWANRHSGSLLDLQPATSYDVELTLTDPDGGSTKKVVAVRTRAVPAPMANAPVKAVTPSNFNSMAAAARPGDVLQLGAGTYNGFNWVKSGVEGKPVVIRSSAGAVINGNIDMFDQSHVQLSGLTVNGRIRLNRTKHVAVTRSTINASTDGIVHYLRSENSYFADNVINGKTVWRESSMGVNGDNVGEGILVTGPGHVIRNNRISGFRDNISLLEASEAVDQYSIDILYNDLRNAADDAVEADFCFHNCRVMRNRITNAFQGISSQPSLGGPTYFIRNAMYNIVLSAFKLNNGSIGDVILHNTVVKNGDGFGVYAGAPVRRAVIRNNLFIGGPGGTYAGYSSGSGKVTSLSDFDATSSADHDAYGSTTGGFSGQIGSARFTSLAALRSSTTEKNALQVGLDGFSAGVAYPSSPMTAYGVPDLQLKSGSPAVDAASRIPNVNDGFKGTGPDIGAYEVGGLVFPVYGPR
ncbi:right-handed parallel beta-helix repeat-containing protein [Schlegelella sp. S2-27]|uniref:Right-handed parallel beta-helix repeat-containing protein n=1 Tax=Caldimonas mangrovi TaxID=2944811 RepID=A0ABT0YNQ2_9BURK|nr:right-handed parallel beta-helix repeat-containing protein [Caldimonas mangrovi]MCM5680364.1 right-handed parallel beta-helix repeat-containing protein [Caldimonas mangrovi]